jgi:hypothetical protein
MDIFNFKALTFITENVHTCKKLTHNPAAANHHIAVVEYGTLARGDCKLGLFKTGECAAVF